MAAENNVVDSIVESRENNFHVGVKMKGKHKNGVILDKNSTISTCFREKDRQNGHEMLSTKLNGFCSHINSIKASPICEGIRASSLRASPVRNKSMTVPVLDSSKNEIKGENR